VDDSLFRWRLGEAHDFRPGELAKYAELRSLSPGQVVPRERFLTADGRYIIRLNPDIMLSDDAILAVLIHETHEIVALEAEFAANAERLSVEDLRSLIDTRVGKLHCEAWDAADRRVLALIEEERWP
jgi:hypothetical protein